MNNITLTGNIRYRMQLFTRKLILQVEIKYIKEIWCGPTFDSYFITEYKDIKLQNFQNIKFRDNIKTQYCKDNGIKLIRIPYFKFKNIEKILKKELLNE